MAAGIDGCEVELMAGEGRTVQGVNAAMDAVEAAGLGPELGPAASEANTQELFVLDQPMLSGGDAGDLLIDFPAIGS